LVDGQNKEFGNRKDCAEGSNYTFISAAEEILTTHCLPIRLAEATKMARIAIQLQKTTGTASSGRKVGREMMDIVKRLSQ
jgi:hypothetical protein